MSTTTLAPQQLRLARSAAPARAGGYRLTRRGRLVVLALGLLAAFAAGVILAAGSMASSQEPGAVPSESVLVQPGDTLWSIASTAAASAGGGDVRDMMTRIDELNELDSSMLDAGQRLLVPTE